MLAPSPRFEGFEEVPEVTARCERLKRRYRNLDPAVIDNLRDRIVWNTRRRYPHCNAEEQLAIMMFALKRQVRGHWQIWHERSAPPIDPSWLDYLNRAPANPFRVDFVDDLIRLDYLSAIAERMGASTQYIHAEMMLGRSLHEIAQQQGRNRLNVYNGYKKGLKAALRRLREDSGL